MSTRDIAVGLLIDDRERVLIGQRLENTDFAGWWEFPGGKFEAGESVQQALARELQEELGIIVRSSEPLITLDWAYPNKRVRLHTRLIRRWSGTPRSCEGQAIDWRPIAALENARLLPANRIIVNALRLPDRYCITPDPADFDSTSCFLDQVSATLDTGIRLLRLRAHSLDDVAYCHLAGQVAALCQQSRADLIIDRNPEMMRSIGAAGLHLTRHALRRSRRRPVPQGCWLSVSCHDPQELALAESVGADFCVLSPVRRSEHHPGRVGWRQFSRWVAETPMPVYALGGMQAEDIAISRRHGGQGIAAVRSLWV